MDRDRIRSALARHAGGEPVLHAVPGLWQPGKAVRRVATALLPAVARGSECLVGLTPTRLLYLPQGLLQAGKATAIPRERIIACEVERTPGRRRLALTQQGGGGTRFSFDQDLDEVDRLLEALEAATR